MIDISPLTGSAINSTANTVTVGGGVNVGFIMSAFQAAGKETSAGIYNYVGFIGATLGGGLGLSQGRYGLMLDSLLSVQLTTATGETMTVSETSQPELFWGLRGAGHNFGIVTEATYRIHDAANEGMQYKADVYFDPEYLKEVFQALNDYDVPAETNAILSFILDSDIKKVCISLVSLSRAAASAELESVFGHIPYLRRTSEMLPWARVNDEILTKGACASRARKVASGVSAKTWDISSIQDAFDGFNEFIELPGTETTIIMFEAYSVKGVQKVPAENTAYPWWEEIGVVVLNVVYDDTKLDAQAADWLFEVMATLHADSGFERPAVYVNYAQVTEGFGAMYGHEEWRQERLKDLKRKWDPKCMFSGYNPIPIKCQE
ncbi:hypothetical protein DFP73DRAFT_487985 [Morchella snyderi]|nr:hypothetical protein DFP73DRAFT_487985 [Morchella snyderi]